MLNISNPSCEYAILSRHTHEYWKTKDEYKTGLKFKIILKDIVFNFCFIGVKDNIRSD